MKAYEFPAKITTEGKIELPNTVLQQLPHNQQVKVLILVNEPSKDDEAWHRLASEELLKSYSEKTQEYIEELLIEGLESGEAIEVTDEWWEQKLRESIERREVCDCFVSLRSTRNDIS